jgi:hypothetical protein
MNIKKYWRKWFRIIHRDLGFFFFGMTIIYGLSGIAINHLKDWNPNYIIKTSQLEINNEITRSSNEKDVKTFLEIHELESLYKKHYFPSSDVMKIFLQGGSVTVDIASQTAVMETIKRRPIFHHVNYLHYNPMKWWTWFSDAFAIAMIIFAITGLFMVKGKKGLWGRGGIYALIGVLIPIIFLILFK